MTSRVDEDPPSEGGTTLARTSEDTLHSTTTTTAAAAENSFSNRISNDFNFGLQAENLQALGVLNRLVRRSMPGGGEDATATGGDSDNSTSQLLKLRSIRVSQLSLGRSEILLYASSQHLHL